MDSDLSLEFLRVVEQAAIACASSARTIALLSSSLPSSRARSASDSTYTRLCGLLQRRARRAALRVRGRTGEHDGQRQCADQQGDQARGKRNKALHAAEHTGMTHGGPRRPRRAGPQER